MKYALAIWLVVALALIPHHQGSAQEAPEASSAPPLWKSAFLACTWPLRALAMAWGALLRPIVFLYYLFMPMDRVL